MNTLQIDRTLVASLNFLTRDDEKWLSDRGRSTISAYNLGGCGWLIVVPSDDAAEFKNEYSEKFINVLSAAQRNHCDYIKFDVDGIEYTDAELK